MVNVGIIRRRIRTSFYRIEWYKISIDRVLRQGINRLLWLRSSWIIWNNLIYWKHQYDIDITLEKVGNGRKKITWIKLKSFELSGTYIVGGSINIECKGLPFSVEFEIFFCLHPYWLSCYSFKYSDDFPFIFLLFFRSWEQHMPSDAWVMPLRRSCCRWH